MNDETGNSNDESAPSEPEGAACGERLAEARRKRQITVLEIAKELHLDEPKVRALENNDFEVLGAPVFAKGHMRKYAELVGVDIDDVLADYYRLTRSSGMPPVVLERPRIRQELSPGPWIFAIVVILAAVLGYWLIVMRATPTVETDVDSPPQITQSILPEEDRVPDDGTAVVLEAADVDETPVNSDAPVAASVEVAVVPERTGETVAEGQLRVAVSFTGECWTEISDADGRRLFFDMGRSGRTVELSGKAPFTALFGNAENVELQVNGSNYEISARDRRGRTARMTIPRPQL
jgi:cytoskeleton protein RodZ